jgi:hypothetical protein
MFNKFFSSFIKDLKTMNESFKTTIKNNYKVIDKSSEEYYNLFWTNVEPHMKALVEMEDPSESELVSDIEIVKGITIKDVIALIDGNDKEAFWNYVNILLVFGLLYTESKTLLSSNTDNTDNTLEHEAADSISSLNENTQGCSKETSNDMNSQASNYLLFVKVVKILSLIQKGEDATDELEDVIDDDVRSLLSKIRNLHSSNDDVKIDPASDTLPAQPNDFLKSIENSHIANLAKEISKDIDISSLNIESPEDIAKLMDVSGSNSFLGNIVSKVSSKLTEKIANGEMKQEDLMTEAMSMMNMFGGGGGGGAMGGIGGITELLKNMGGLGDLMGNPMMAEMMKMAKKGKVQTKNSSGSRTGSTSTRERLRRKLEDKKKRTDEK